MQCKKTILNRLVLTATLSLVAVGLAACLFVPDDADDGRATILVNARFDDDAGKQPECPDIDLSKVEDMSALATIIRMSDPDDPTSEDIIAGEGVLSVTSIEDDGQDFLELVGEVGFDLGPDGSIYDLEVTLFLQGFDPVGEYYGEMVLGSGIVVTVNRLVVPSLVPSGSDPDLLQAVGSAVEVCLSSSSVADNEVFCTTEDTQISSQFPIFYNTSSNQMSYRYERSITDWDGPERDEGVIFVEILGGLAPSPIRRGSARLTGVVPGTEEPIEVDLTLDCGLDTFGPGDDGELLVGTVLVGFTDGLPPEETGSFELTRGSMIGAK